MTGKSREEGIAKGAKLKVFLQYCRYFDDCIRFNEQVEELKITTVHIAKVFIAIFSLYSNTQMIKYFSERRKRIPYLTNLEVMRSLVQ